MVGNACFHCWRNAQRLMNPAEIVMHVMECNGVFQILQLLAESVSQSSEPAHRHSHRQILALNVAGRNMPALRDTANYSLARTYADCRAIAGFRIRSRAIYLLKLCVIYVLSEGLSDTAQISNVTVRCKLNAICKTALEITHKMVGSPSVALTNKPAWNELCISKNSRTSNCTATPFATPPARESLWSSQRRRIDPVQVNYLPTKN